MEKEFIQTIENRSSKIMRVSIAGIIVNILLAITKLIIGFSTNSIAIIGDAMNNISDFSSSIITIVGTKIANKKPDREHPFGHGRIEYLTALIIGLAIFATGLQILISSIKSLNHKSDYSFNFIVVIIMFVTIIVKIILGIYTEIRGKYLGSEALVGSGKDSKNDALVTSVAFISMIIYIYFKISIDSIAGSIISLFILKSGFEIIFDTIKMILGKRVDEDISKAVYNMIDSNDLIISAHDLILNTYGPSTIIGSINVDIDHEKTVGQIYPILHKLQLEIYEKLKIYLVFGIYSIDKHSIEAKKVLEILKKIEKNESYILGCHGVIVDKDNNEIYCDILLDFMADKEDIKSKIEKILGEEFPEYKLHITLDLEFA